MDEEKAKAEKMAAAKKKVITASWLSSSFRGTSILIK